MEGWIKLHNKFLKWGWYDKPEMVSLFIYLLLSANYQDKEWHGITIKRGQTIIGTRKLPKIIGISRQTLRSSLTRLKSTREITLQPTRQFTIVTIVKYDEYQQVPEIVTLKATRLVTQEQPASNPLVTPPIEYKDIKNNIIRGVTPSTMANKFFSDVDYQEEISKQISDKYNLELKTVKEEINKFISYWTEPNKSGSKTRWQMQNTFEVSRRLATWFGNIGKFSGNNFKNIITEVIL